MGALISAADPSTHQAKILNWWIRDAIRDHFDPVTDDEIDEALILLADGGAMSLFDDPHGQTWFRLSPHLWPSNAPQMSEPPHPQQLPQRSFPSAQTGASRPRFEPADEESCTQGARDLREGESARARGREGASASGPGSPPEMFCPIHRPTGAGFDDQGNPITCPVCGDHRMVWETWMITNGFRKPSRR
jgi:hypothetical protein